MGTSAIADREAMLAALAQIETLTAQMNRLSIDAFTDAELLDVQQRREAVVRRSQCSITARISGSPPKAHRYPWAPKVTPPYWYSGCGSPPLRRTAGWMRRRRWGRGPR